MLNIKPKEYYVETILNIYLDVKQAYEFKERSLTIYESLLEAYLINDITADDLVWIRYQLNYIKDELMNYREFPFYYVSLWDMAGLPIREGLKYMTGIYECSQHCLMSNYIDRHWCFRYPSLHELTIKGNYIYMLFDGSYDADSLIYIGQTKNPNSRLWTHQKDKDFDRVSLTSRGLRNGKLNSKSVLSLEKKLIKHLSPDLNIQHNTKAKSL